MLTVLLLLANDNPLKELITNFVCVCVCVGFGDCFTGVPYVRATWISLHLKECH